MCRVSQETGDVAVPIRQKSKICCLPFPDPSFVLFTQTVCDMSDKITRIAIVDANRCKPKRCAQECKKVDDLPFSTASSALIRLSHVQL
jgi:hypothetical protein